MKRPFYLICFIIVIAGTGWLLYQSYTAPSLTTGECTSQEKPIYQTIERKTDNTTWCLSGLPRTAIHWQWSPDNGRFAYALQDKNNPTRQLSGRWGYAEIDNLNWYIMKGTGGGHRRFSEPDPHFFSFSPDGQYAEYSTYNDYGKNKYVIVKIANNHLICRYELYNLWYSEGTPPCNNIKLRDGTIWDIRTEQNRDACEYHVTAWQWFDQLEKQGCRELLKGTDLVPTLTPPSYPYPAPVLQEEATPYLSYPAPIVQEETTPYP